MEDITPTPEVTPLRAARDAANMSREELAFKAGVSVKTIERAERGESVPHRVTKNAIARILRSDVATLFPEPAEAAA